MGEEGAKCSGDKLVRGLSLIALGAQQGADFERHLVAQGRVHVLLGLEVIVEGPRRERRGADDVADGGRSIAVQTENPACSIQDDAAVMFLGLGTLVAKLHGGPHRKYLPRYYRGLARRRVKASVNPTASFPQKFEKSRNLIQFRAFCRRFGACLLVPSPAFGLIDPIEIRGGERVFGIQCPIGQRERDHQRAAERGGRVQGGKRKRVMLCERRLKCGDGGRSSARRTPTHSQSEASRRNARQPTSGEGPTRAFAVERDRTAIQPGSR